MKRKAVSFFILAAACVGGALSQDVLAIDEADFRFDNTSELYDICVVETYAPEYPIANQACRAFIEATVQYHDGVSAYKKLKHLICYPASATIEDGKQAFLAWAKQHADDKKLMAEQPVVGLMRSLAAKYPCKE